MTIALASRGYLCFRTMGGATVFGPGPKLVSADELAPEIDAAGIDEAIESPTIMNGTELAPSVVGATEEVTPVVSDDAPSIVNGSELNPSIVGAEEE